MAIRGASASARLWLGKGPKAIPSLSIHQDPLASMMMNQFVFTCPLHRVNLAERHLFPDATEPGTIEGIGPPCKGESRGQQ